VVCDALQEAGPTEQVVVFIVAAAADRGMLAENDAANVEPGFLDVVLVAGVVFMKQGRTTLHPVFVAEGKCRILQGTLYVAVMGADQVAAKDPMPICDAVRINVYAVVLKVSLAQSPAHDPGCRRVMVSPQVLCLNPVELVPRPWCPSNWR